jgi:hypothetical protein
MSKPTKFETVSIKDVPVSEAIEGSDRESSGGAGG